MFDNLRRRLAWRAELRELDQKQAPATLAKPDDSNPGHRYSPTWPAGPRRPDRA